MNKKFINLKNGSILLYKQTKDNIVQNSITKITESDFVHAALYLDNKIFESTIWFKKLRIYTGIKISLYYKERYYTAPYNFDLILEPKSKLSKFDIIEMEYNIYNRINYRKPYNIFKLLILAYIYPKKIYWNNRNWLPFDKEFFGEVCSVFVDNVYLDLGIDILPGLRKGITAPVDLLKSKFFNKKYRKCII